LPDLDGEQGRLAIGGEPAREGHAEADFDGIGGLGHKRAGAGQENHRSQHCDQDRAEDRPRTALPHCNPLSLRARTEGAAREWGPDSGSARRIVKRARRHGFNSSLDIARPSGASYARGLITESRRPSTTNPGGGTVIVDRYSKIILTVIAIALIVIAARPLLPEAELRAWLLPEVAQAQTPAPKYEVTIPKAW